MTRALEEHGTSFSAFDRATITNFSTFQTEMFVLINTFDDLESAKKTAEISNF